MSILNPTPPPEVEPTEEEPTPPIGYTAEELERDNPYNQWMYEQ